MKFPFTSIVNSENETAEVAKDFSKLLTEGDVVLFEGDLGSGKTFFIKSICTEFKIENASSPSFSIVNEYSGTNNIYHFDFYRIKRLQELLDIGFNDYLNGDAIVLIEWADMFKEILPHKNYKITIEFINDSSRKISIIKNG